MRPVVRLERIKINNIKNIANGEIKFSDQNLLVSGKNSEIEHSKIIGIYGQNGSGKTAVLDTLKLVQRLLAGKVIDKNVLQLIRYNCDYLKIETDFYLEYYDKNFYVNYVVKNLEILLTITIF